MYKQVKFLKAIKRKLLRSRGRCSLGSCRRKLWISSRLLITLAFQSKLQNKSCYKLQDQLKGQFLKREDLHPKKQNNLWPASVIKNKAAVKPFQSSLTIVNITLQCGTTIAAGLNLQPHTSTRCNIPCNTIRRSSQCITVECLRECHLVGVCHKITIPTRSRR